MERVENETQLKSILGSNMLVLVDLATWGMEWHPDTLIIYYSTFF